MSEYASRESKNLKPKMLGATSIQMGEDDVSRLVGGIVEKGFSEARQTRPLAPPSGPLPTVLPFPLARHRSHGPHWAPRVGNSNLHNGKDNEDEFDGEEEDFEGRAVAAAANPLQRKEKRGLDFSRWREIAKKAGSSGFHEKEEGRCSNGDKVEPKETKMASNGDAQFQSMIMTNNVSTIREAKGEAKDASHLASAKEFHSFEYGRSGNNVHTMQYQQDGIAESAGNTVVERASTWQNGLSKEVDLKRENMPKPHTTSDFSGKALVGGEENSLQSQIDAENRARLANMSADELAEAQAEIMAKLNPKLIDALKKRGQGKDKRQKSYETDVTGSASDDMQHEEPLPKISENTVSHEPMEIETENALMNKEDNVSPNVSPNKGSIWNAWSKRVERVRDVRFSLDGNIIGFGMESDIGKCTSEFLKCTYLKC